MGRGRCFTSQGSRHRLKRNKAHCKLVVVLCIGRRVVGEEIDSVRVRVDRSQGFLHRHHPYQSFLACRIGRPEQIPSASIPSAATWKEEAEADRAWSTEGGMTCSLSYPSSLTSTMSSFITRPITFRSALFLLSGEAF